jgi:hypothetical protein
VDRVGPIPGLNVAQFRCVSLLLRVEATAARAGKRLYGLALAWPLWGVLAAGILSSLLWVRGPDLFGGHRWELLSCLIAAPVAGGMLTPEKPKYTVIVFAVGSYPPLNDIGPIPPSIWPFVSIYQVLIKGEHAGILDLITSFPFAFALAALLTALSGLLLAPLVYLGWAIRRWIGLR